MIATVWRSQPLTGADYGRKSRAPAGVIARARRFVRSAVAKAVDAVPGERYFIRLQFPPSAREGPRYGFGHPPHERLLKLLSRADDDYREVLIGFKGYADDLGAIPRDRTSSTEPHWRNEYLFGLDGVSLYSFTRQRAPSHYVEIGSGNSTLFVDRARRDAGSNVEIISIDPNPRREIDVVCDRILREPIECTNLDVFDDVEGGDMVFLDGSHHVFMNSDVTVFFLDVLPELPPGVLVGIHDIHLPDDYRPEHARRQYSEQYLLATYILAEAEWIRPVLPCWYVTHHPALGSLARSLVPHPVGHGVIFWLMTGPRK